MCMSLSGDGWLYIYKSWCKMWRPAFNKWWTCSSGWSRCCHNEVAIDILGLDALAISLPKNVLECLLTLISTIINRLGHWERSPIWIKRCWRTPCHFYRWKWSLADWNIIYVLTSCTTIFNQPTGKISLQRPRSWRSIMTLQKSYIRNVCQH